ncbi:phospho-N-acetylmuramoyl-pentapeptide-transferase, partial [bacterium]|nr:phospho-N-acetylmuramoyl-pentapeptide-transferase [bacterium]
MLAEFVDSITLRSIYSLVISYFVTLVLGPYVIARLKEKRIGQSIRAEGVKAHLEKSGIPTMGGIIIIVSVVVSTIIWARFEIQLTLVLASFLWMGILGFMDDFLKITKKNSDGLIARQKLLGQVSFGLIVGVYLYQASWMSTDLFVPIINVNLELGYGYVLLVILTIVGSSNAVNLTDGLDGLATGIMFIVIGCMGVLTYLSGNAIYSNYLNIPHLAGTGELTIFCMALVGACLGFLWYNSSPAQVFMGDTGSLALGGALGTVAILCKAELFLVVIGGIFVVEAISVILQVGSFRLRGKRIFKMAPIHHHFELL